MVREEHSYWETNEDDELECYLYEIRKSLADGVKIDDIGKMFPLSVDSGFAKKKARNQRLYRHLKQAGYEASKVGDEFRYCPIEQLTAMGLWDIFSRRMTHASGTLRNVIALIASTPIQPSFLTKTSEETREFKLQLLKYAKLTLQGHIEYIDKVANRIKTAEERSKKE